MAFRKKRKAEMLIITVVFLIGFVFSVQQNLLHYSAVDISDPLENNDLYLMKNVEQMFTELLMNTESEEECINMLLSELINLRSFLNTQIFRGGYVLESDFSLDCNNWDSSINAPLTITIRIIGENELTDSTFDIFRFT